ncbi:MAG: CDGSH iron-sulfur domain-containing protein [Acidobacteria bacterium]|nr:CDGSH iron-sulfur domain-containing protein [Acidobacteriota bacterium]
MAEPTVFDRKPAVLEVEAGARWWCACGLSKGQPFCDGTHKGTGISPVKCEFAEKQKVAFCNCKHSKNGAFCDGTHKSL